jgi:hypothetical protein
MDNDEEEYGGEGAAVTWGEGGRRKGMIGWA